ncbi:hypothetical protein B4065_1623 [Caldibacillus thermoamylovorans]|nr:hypothetical protein B4065_1623 [Caldibacillus thermoamylovorans]
MNISFPKILLFHIINISEKYQDKIHPCEIIMQKISESKVRFIINKNK